MQSVMDKKFEYILRRGVAEIIVEEELVQLLEGGRQLRLKMGFDPSRPDIHLGHVVGMRKLRQFQDVGHQVVLIVGDWTAQIGDPSGASQTRPMLSADEVRANAETYMQQFFKVVDREKTELRWQSEWFGNFSLADVVSLTSKFTVAQLLAREDFNKRHASGRPIAITELLYPLLQAYDSVVIEADVEFGGVDQKFNCLMGRELQQMMGQRPQHVFLMPLLVGTDGQQKMSKSLDNYIAIEDPPNDMYGKVMSIPDQLMMDYFELLTDVDDGMLREYSRLLSDNSKNPMEMKKSLAREIVGQFHGAEAAQKAESHFKRVVQRKKVPEDIAEVALSFGNPSAGPNSDLVLATGRGPGFVAPGADWHEALPATLLIDLPGVLVRAGLVSSRQEARRLMAHSAVKVGRYAETDEVTFVQAADSIKIEIAPDTPIRVGKRRWVKIVDADSRPASTG